MALNKGGKKKPTQHYCVSKGCTRKDKVVYLTSGDAKQFKSINAAKHFMRTGE